MKTSLPLHLRKPDPNVYLSDDYLVLDFETDGFPGDPKSRIVLSGWKRNGKPYKALWADEYHLGELHRELDECKYVVAQNAKFELQWLIRSGYDISKLIVADTMLAEYVILGNRRGPKDLNSLGKKYVKESKENLVSLLFKGGASSTDIPTGWLRRYNKQDVFLTETIWLSQREELRSLQILPVYYTRCLTTIPIAEVETRGIYLDKDRVELKLKEVEVEHSAILTKLINLAGGINFNSPKQVGELLYDKLKFAETVDYRGELSRTESGGRRTDEGAISNLVVKTPDQREFKLAFTSYRKLNLALRNLQKMQTACVEDQGIIYGTLNQAITQTHRLSSSGGKYKLQFQNFDRDFKGLFTARQPGWTLAEADGKQLEFRVAVHLGNDEQGLKDVRSNFDVHRNTGRVLFNKPLDKVTTEERTAAKSRTFKPLYGGSSGSPRERAYYESFKERYNGIYETQCSWTREVLLRGKLCTQTGLIFYWPGTKQLRSGYIENTTSIFNYPVQSLATADIIPISLVYLWHLMKARGMKSFLVNTVHDSVIGEIAPGEEDTFIQLCRLAFTSYVFDYLKDVYGITFICPLGVETKIGSHWGQKEKYQDEHDLDPEIYFASAA